MNPLPLLLLVSLMFLSALSNNAQAATFSPAQVMQHTNTATGATVATKFTAKAANQAVYAMRAVQIPKATVANVMRTRSFSPWGIAITAAITAAGYYFDSLNEEIYTSQSPSYPDGLGTCVWNGNNNVGTTTASQCLNGEGVYAHNSSVIATWIQDGVQYDESPQPEPISDDQLFDVYKSMSPIQQQSIFENPYSSAPNPDIQEFTDAAQDVTNDYTAENDGDPATVPTVNPETGDTGTEEITEDEPQEKDLCQRYPNILACTELDDVPDASQIATQDIPFSYTPYSLSSNASCPADVDTPAGPISYGPSCQLASGIKPVVIAVFTLAGLLVLGGFKDNG